MVPSACAFAKKPVHAAGHLQPELQAHLIRDQPGTQRPGDLLRGLRHSLQPLSQPAAIAHVRLPAPCSATRSLSADSNSTSEPSSSVNRTNSAITHPQDPHQSRRQTVTHILPHPRPIHGPITGNGRRYPVGTRPSSARLIHRGQAQGRP